MRTVLTLAATLSLVVALCTDQRGSAAPPKKSPPVALVVTYGGYDPENKLKPLARTVPSGVELAKQLSDAGYQVEFLTGSDTDKALLRALPKAVTVANADDGEALTKHVREWVARTADPSPPLAVLALLGHGEERGGVPHLLARNDPPGKGGLSLDDIHDATGKASGFPLVVVFDACRTAAPPPPKLNVLDGKDRPVEPGKLPPATDRPDAGKGSEGGRFPDTGERVVVVRHPAKGQPATVLYSTRSGEKAEDSNDLTTNLARGVKCDADVQKFLLYIDPEWPVRKSLTLYHWFYYGVAAQLRETKLAQSHEIRLGRVELSAPVAVIDPRSGKPGPPPRAFNRDLLTEYTPQFGGYTSKYDPDRGWQITCPAKLTKEWFAVGGIGGADEVEVADGVLEIDLIASPRPGKVGPVFTFEVHPKRNADVKGTNDVYFTRKIQPYAINYQRLYRLTLALASMPGVEKNAPPLRMNQLAFGEPDRLANPGKPLGVWPEGATLTITGLRVRKRLDGDPVEKTHHFNPLLPDLITSWLPSDRGDSPLTVSRDDAANEKFRWCLTPTQADTAGRVGGPLLTPTTIPDGHVLLVEVRNAGKEAGDLTVSVGRAEDGKPIRKLGAATVRVPAGTSQKLTVPVDTPGVANYMTLETKSKDLRVKSITVRAEHEVKTVR